MLAYFDKPIISNYSPISSKGGSKRRRTRKFRTRKYKRSNKSRTRRRHR
jgi:hypothetical protein